MSKEQFWTLNVVGGVCALLILLQLVLSVLNNQDSQSLMFKQNQLNRAEQMHTAIQNLVTRIAEAGRTDPALQAVLTRQDIKLNNPGKPTKPRR